MAREQDVADLRRAFDAAREARTKGRFDDALRLVEGFTERLAEVSARHLFGQPPTRPGLSIVVLSHRDHPDVDRALEALAADCAGQTHELILVDDGNSALFDSAKRHFPSFLGLKPPFSIGCAAGRNLGALLARGPAVTFLDDDGIIEPGCLAALQLCMAETGAVAVRGKVVPHTGGIGEGHYDLGAVRRPTFINCEGVSIWQRDCFLQAGGFNPLLAGHEGNDLCARLWRFHGPLAFVYEPDAILRHDYASDIAHVDLKRAAIADNRAFVEFSSREPFRVASGIGNLLRRKHASRLVTRIWDRGSTAASKLDDWVSILVVTSDSRTHLEAFSESLRRQQNQRFELVFVDQSPGNRNAAAMRQVWSDDDRLICLDGSSMTAGAALNLAMSHARHDICLLSYVEDISTVRRIDLTLAHLAADPGAACVSFLTFNEAEVFGRMAGSDKDGLNDVNLRILPGSEPEWSTFAFRKTLFTVPFEAAAEVDLHRTWLWRNLESTVIRGLVDPTPLVYSPRPPPDAAARLQLMESARRTISILSGTTAGRGGAELLRVFSQRVLLRNASADLYDQRILRRFLSRQLKRLGGEALSPPSKGQKMQAGGWSLVRWLRRRFR